MRIDFLNFDINIHKYSALDILTINRNEIKKEHRSKIFKDFLKSAFNIISRHFDAIFPTDGAKWSASMFIHYYYSPDISSEKNVLDHREWEKYRIMVNNETMELGDIVSKANCVKLIKNLKKNDTEYEFKNNELIISSKEYFNDGYTTFILHELRPKFIYMFKVIIDDKEAIIVTDREIKNIFTEDDIRLILSDTMSSYSQHTRYVIPCLDKYSKLQIKRVIPNIYLGFYKIGSFYGTLYSPMISPFIYYFDGNHNLNEVSLTEEIYNFVYENRNNKEVTLQQIKDEYQKFITEFNVEELNKINTDEFNKPLGEMTHFLLNYRRRRYGY
jgi:hypothetical protein